MTAGDFLARAEALPFGTLADVTGGGGVVVVAPHPDDESLGCGGLIAAARASGVSVRVVVISDGAGSHPNSASYPMARLRDLREAETREAMLEVGLADSEIRFLRLPDRFVPCRGPEAEAACDAIVAAVAECEAGAVCVTWARDPHCDHVAAAAIVDAARARLGETRVWSYPVWGWTLPPGTDVGDAPRGLRLDITRHLAAKTAAVARHCSQTTDLIADDPHGFRLTPAMLAHFARPYEILLEVEPT